METVQIRLMLICRCDSYQQSIFKGHQLVSKLRYFHQTGSLPPFLASRPPNHVAQKSRECPARFTWNSSHNVGNSSLNYLIRMHYGVSPVADASRAEIEHLIDNQRALP
jgi:hypothetical protein